MTKRVEKRDLPTKVCLVCGRPFTWRRKWAARWDEVRYCSERCRRAKGDVDTRGCGSSKAAAATRG